MNTVSAIARSAAYAAIITTAWCAVATAQSQTRAITDLRVTKVGNLATARIEFACTVGYSSHGELDETGAMVIRLSLNPNCANTLGRGEREELYRPQNGALARIREIAFDTENGLEATLTVRLDVITSVEVRQDSARDSLLLEVDAVDVAAELPDPGRADAAAGPERSVAATGTRGGPTNARGLRREAATDRTPIRIVGPAPPGGPELYVVQLDAGPNLRLADGSQLAADDDRVVYVVNRTIADRRWQELRVGFFESERDARLLLDRVLPNFPDAIVGIADPAEQAQATATLRASPDASTEPTVTRSTPLDDGPDAHDSEDDALASARRALMSGDYDRSIVTYARLLAQPEFEQRQTALEFLGVAYERAGRYADARATYEVYLTEFPGDAGATRVGQRMAGLLATVDASAAEPVLVDAANEKAARPLWDVSGGVSQYYRDDRYRLVESEPLKTSQSAVLSQVDLSVDRNGSRFDFESRLNAMYVYDLLDAATARDDQALVSRAYFRIADKDKDWGVQIGRQFEYGRGLLGRFDGAHANFRFKPRVMLNVTTGFPVETPHSAFSDRREFVGVSADLEHFIGDWDISVFTMQQRVDGIADREAIGGEAHYRSERWNLVTALDLDLAYAIANSALFAANWRATDKLTFNARVDVRAAPFLTTHNAIIGQSVLTVEELLDTYSESQVRRIARDRTAQARTASLGFSWPIFDRFQMNSDVTYTEYDATVSSAGIAQQSASDPQLYFLLNFIGSSLFRDNDTAIFELRHYQTRTAETAALIFDLRVPLGPKLRLNPRFVVSQRNYWVDRSSEWFAEPTLRLLMRLRGRHRFEAEVGGLWSSRSYEPGATLGALPDEKTTGRFLNMGYWWEF